MTLSGGASPEKTVPGVATFDAIAGELAGRFSEGVRTEWSDEDFRALAHRVFSCQFAHNATYRRYCERGGATPRTVRDWRDVPMVPTRAFRRLDLVVGDPSAVEAVFHTSGTTGRGGEPGRHLVPRLSLYRASLLPAFKRHMMPDVERIRFLSLIPDSSELPGSSLSHMVDLAAVRFASDVRFVVDGSGRLDADSLERGGRDAREVDEPVLLLGTAFALVHALDRSALPVLPGGSRIMVTGGFKGRSREVSRDELYSSLSSATSVPISRIVSEYGMTELQSQLYSTALSEPGSDHDHLVPPPWLRVRALDPTTLEVLGDGVEGLLAFFDLANAGSVCHVLTEDLGLVSHGRVRLSGRVEGAEPRGCSRAMDDLMAVSGTPA